ncbi:MAG: hypothetical protein JWO33_664 [Caulobacteraceae bacterium]|nr:hypothetical protein [Caulobacteraceae bacterium]
MFKPLIFCALSLSLCACATAQPPHAGFLSSYDGLEKQPHTTRHTMRAAVRERTDQQALAHVRKVAIEPAVFASRGDASWLSDDERAMLLREVDAQLCFELSETYEMAPLDQADAVVRTAVTDVRATGRTSSVAAAAVGFLIPGPIGLRPGQAGGLTAESEMIDRATERQLAALTWSRQANMIGTDNPSMSRVGDAMQFAEPFGDAAHRAFKTRDAKKLTIATENDPCRSFGPRFRVEGFAARFATGLYMPGLSKAKGDKTGGASTVQTRAAVPADAGATTVDVAAQPPATPPAY